MVIAKRVCVFDKVVPFGLDLLNSVGKSEILIDHCSYIARVGVAPQELGIPSLQNLDLLILLLQRVVESVLLVEEPCGGTLHGAEILRIELKVETGSRHCR